MKKMLKHYWISRSVRERNLLKFFMLISLISALLLLKKIADEWRDEVRYRQTLSAQTLAWMNKNRNLLLIREDKESCLNELVRHLPEPRTLSGVNGERVLSASVTGVNEMAGVLTRPALTRINCPSTLEIEWVKGKLQLSVEVDRVK